MAQPIYIVTLKNPYANDPKPPVVRLVQAPRDAGAVRHVISDLISVKRAEPLELHQLAKEGYNIEIAAAGDKSDAS